MVYHYVNSMRDDANNIVFMQIHRKCYLPQELLPKYRLNKANFDKSLLLSYFSIILTFIFYLGLQIYFSILITW